MGRTHRQGHRDNYEPKPLYIYEDDFDYRKPVIVPIEKEKRGVIEISDNSLESLEVTNEQD